jgi:hypothetical protein
MAVETFMEEARMLAAQCWCDDETKNRVMDPKLAEAVAKRIAVWMDEYATMATNASFYRDLLMQCAHNLGSLREKAYIQDDGGVVDEPLVLKIPELVAELAAWADN